MDLVVPFIFDSDFEDYSFHLSSTKSFYLSSKLRGKGLCFINSSSFGSMYRQRLRSYRQTESVEEKLWVLGNDLVAKILSHMPPQPLMMFKCTCKSWYKFISDPIFQRIYTQSWITKLPDEPVCIFTQSTSHCCDRLRDALQYICPSKNISSRSILDFLPVKTALVGSSRGILCCRNLNTSLCRKVHHNLMYTAIVPAFEPSLPLVFYICNPATKEWISLSPPLGLNLGKAFGFSFDPERRNFVIVGVQPCEGKPDWSSFVIYDSTLKTWRTTRWFYFSASKICVEKHVFLNDRCYWLIETRIENEHMPGFELLIFDIKNEACDVIKLPYIVFRFPFRKQGCLGVSQGQIHYAYTNRSEVTIWRLEGCCYTKTPQWVLAELKFPPLSTLIKVNNEVHVELWYLHESILFYTDNWLTLCSYDMRTGAYHRILGYRYSSSYSMVCLPYSPTIFQLKSRPLTSPILRCCTSKPAPMKKRRKKSIVSPKRSAFS